MARTGQPRAQPPDSATVLPRPIVSLDGVEIWSWRHRHAIERDLPMRLLRSLNPTFHLAWPGKSDVVGCRICFTWDGSAKFMEALLEHEQALGRYVFSKVEVAIDFPAKDDEHARDLTRWLIPRVRKPWHRRDHVHVEAGAADGQFGSIPFSPFLYAEDRRSQTGIHIYGRLSKDDGQVPLARVEWSIRKAPNIEARTGIRVLVDLATFDGETFLRRHLELEELDWEALGRWLPRKARCSPIRAAGLFLRRRQYRELREAGVLDPDPEQIEATYLKWHSALQVRSWLRKQARLAKAKHGRRSRWEQRVMRLTAYRLGRFARALKWDGGAQ